MPKYFGYPQHPDAHPERPWWRRRPYVSCCRYHHERSDGAILHQWSAAVDPAVLAAYDAAHPLPPPPPRCAQVWVWPGADMGPSEALVEVTVDGGVLIGSTWHDADRWPPPRAVLVAGPGAPWAPMWGDSG